MLVVVTRFPVARLERGNHVDATVRLPEKLLELPWREVLSGTDVIVGSDGIAIEPLLKGVAVSVLVPM
jgi:hypothetical protein